MLPSDENHELGCATSGESGELYYFTILEGGNEDKVTTTTAYLYHASISDGSTILKKTLDTEFMSIWKYFRQSTMAYSSTLGVLALHVLKLNPMAGDGLNHQGAGLW